MSRHAFNEAPVLAALARAPGHHAPIQIAQRLGITIEAAKHVLSRLVVKQKVRCLGKAKTLGITEVHGRAMVYALNDSRAQTTSLPIDIRIAQPRTIPQYHFGWGDGGRGRVE